METKTVIVFLELRIETLKERIIELQNEIDKTDMYRVMHFAIEQAETKVRIDELEILIKYINNGA